MFDQFSYDVRMCLSIKRYIDCCFTNNFCRGSARAIIFCLGITNKFNLGAVFLFIKASILPESIIFYSFYTLWMWYLFFVKQDCERQCWTADLHSLVKCPFSVFFFVLVFLWYEIIEAVIKLLGSYWITYFPTFSFNLTVSCIPWSDQKRFLLVTIKFQSKKFH